MLDKKFILTARDFGSTNESNRAVLEAYVNGFLSNCSIVVNGQAFDSAINDILPDCPNLSIGIALNIHCGKSLTDCPLITNKNGEFDKNYFKLIFNLSNNVLSQIEDEFRAQIKNTLNYFKPTFLELYKDMYAHPKIFEIVCKLAVEFDIKYIKTNYENIFFISKLEKYLNIYYPINFLSTIIMNIITRKNREIIDKYNLKTNDFIICLQYRSLIDTAIIESALDLIEEDALVECVIYPKKYTNCTKDSHTKDFGISCNLNLEEKIKKLGFETTNYKILEKNV